MAEKKKKTGPMKVDAQMAGGNYDTALMILDGRLDKGNLFNGVDEVAATANVLLGYINTIEQNESQWPNQKGPEEFRLAIRDLAGLNGSDTIDEVVEEAAAPVVVEQPAYTEPAASDEVNSDLTVNLMKLLTSQSLEHKVSTTESGAVVTLVSSYFVSLGKKLYGREYKKDGQKIVPREVYQKRILAYFKSMFEEFGLRQLPEIGVDHTTGEDFFKYELDVSAQTYLNFDRRVRSFVDALRKLKGTLQPGSSRAYNGHQSDEKLKHVEAILLQYAGKR